MAAPWSKIDQAACTTSDGQTGRGSTWDRER